MKAALAFAVCVLSASPAAAADDSASLQAAAQSFYAAYEAVPHGGIPGNAARAKFAPLVSPALSGLIEKAAAAEESFEQLTKNQVPPLLEGDIFTSLFEGATSFSVGACTADGAAGHCAVALTYADPKAKPVTWTDTAYLVRTPAGWKLDDIGYGGTWDFGNKGRLTATLGEAIADAGN